ncbi:MAG: hypothetical protein MK486_10710 [Gemmatimonadetes bacterium]|jgi:hypothetical protein|nr:hypothetical protein [Gemmatimonadota bacterium]HIN49958.1 hypothetical protein [Gemmatimonadota bacterium]|tara:strand:+ start:872 stop:1378 length:507 start_codon:yes stop_codon:yes gene_type:complete
MSLRTLFEWVDAFPSSIAMRESIFAFPVLLTVHVVSLVMFAGLVMMMDLRLLGAAYRGTPFSEVQARLFPWQMVGMVVTSIAGLLLFYSQPMRYFGKLLYWIKMGLIVLAGVNAMLFHFTTYRSIAKWDTTSPPLGAKVAGVLSLAMWACIVAFGRLTAYDYDWATFE